MHAARQAGYQEGYRDGLVALDNFKRSVLQQNAAQFGAVMQQFDEQLDALEFDMARALSRVAASIAQQVVRDELMAKPERIARVTQEAVEAVLLSARHIVVQVNPQDLALVEQGAADAIAARGARLVSDPGIERGGCRVLSDVGTIDARIGARWQHASASIGVELPWSATTSCDRREARSAMSRRPLQANRRRRAMTTAATERAARWRRYLADLEAHAAVPRPLVSRACWCA